jgi:TetR/AcrR family transcriptional regulator, regulator of autoinduction and epiphytic fitness
VDDVKAQPGRRERKALATRRRILDAAEALFVHDGYVATTISAIADAADVAVQTVYAVFGSKRAMLTELLAIRTVGDDDAAPLRARAEWKAMETETDSRRQLVLVAAIATRIGSRMADLYEVMAGAAASDPDIAEVYERQQQIRYRDQHRVARALSRHGDLRVGLSAAHATDIMWTIANPRTYRNLVGERAWTAQQYERWLADVLIDALLERTRA